MRALLGMQLRLGSEAASSMDAQTGLRDGSGGSSSEANVGDGSSKGSDSKGGGGSSSSSGGSKGSGSSQAGPGSRSDAGPSLPGLACAVYHEVSAVHPGNLQVPQASCTACPLLDTPAFKAAHT